MDELTKTQRERRERLMPDGVPKYVRIYYNEGQSRDPYLIVFNGRYRNIGRKRGQGRTDEGIYIVTANENPSHPTHGIYQHGEWREFMDAPEGWPVQVGRKHKDFGKRVSFESLTPDLRRCIAADYLTIWQLKGPVPTYLPENEVEVEAKEDEKRMALPEMLDESPQTSRLVVVDLEAPEHCIMANSRFSYCGQENPENAVAVALYENEDLNLPIHPDCVEVYEIEKHKAGRTPFVGVALQSEISPEICETIFLLIEDNVGYLMVRADFEALEHDQRVEFVNWGTAIYYRASDNDDVVIPPRPSFLLENDPKNFMHIHSKVFSLETALCSQLLEDVIWLYANVGQPLDEALHKGITPAGMKFCSKCVRRYLEKRGPVLINTRHTSESESATLGITKEEELNGNQGRTYYFDYVEREGLLKLFDDNTSELLEVLACGSEYMNGGEFAEGVRATIVKLYESKLRGPKDTDAETIRKATLAAHNPEQLVMESSEFSIHFRYQGLEDLERVKAARKEREAVMDEIFAGLPMDSHVHWFDDYGYALALYDYGEQGGTYNLKQKIRYVLVGPRTDILDIIVKGDDLCLAPDIEDSVGPEAAVACLELLLGCTEERDALPERHRQFLESGEMNNLVVWPLYLQEDVEGQEEEVQDGTE